MQFLSSVMHILPKKLLLPVALLSLSIPFSVASSAKAEENTSVVCYFQKNFSSPTWQWGLKPNNRWYKLGGRWQIEGITKFKTSKSRWEIIKSCQQSQRYYRHNDKKLIGIYAANSSLGRNYAIYSKGQEVKP